MTKPVASQRDFQDVREEAAARLLRRQAGSRRDDADLAAWLRQDPDHRRAYDEVIHAWESLGAMAAVPAVSRLRTEALLRNPPLRTRVAPAMWAAAAAGVLLTILALPLGMRLWSAAPGGPAAVEDYVTRKGQTSAVTLADGSIVTLDTQSRLRVAFSPSQRRLQLVSGQAYFQVAHDVNRPFVVRAEDREVVAVGTEFDVRLDPQQTSVTLVKGKVLARPAQGGPSAAGRAPISLLPGDRLTFVSGHTTSVIDQVDVGALTSWRAGRLSFDAVRLADAAREMNRYATTPIVIADPELNDLRVSGSFQAGQVASFAAGLSEVFPIRLRETREGIVLTRRRGR